MHTKSNQAPQLNGIRAEANVRSAPSQRPATWMASSGVEPGPGRIEFGRNARAFDASTYAGFLGA